MCRETLGDILSTPSPAYSPRPSAQATFRHRRFLSFRVSGLRIPVRPRLRQIPVKPRLRGPGRMGLPADLSWRRRPVAGAGHRLGTPGLAEQAVFQGCRDLNTVGTTVVSAVAGAYAITKVLGGNADGAKGGDRDPRDRRPARRPGAARGATLAQNGVVSRCEVPAGYRCGGQGGRDDQARSRGPGRGRAGWVRRPDGG
jgi:hypothetical protein